MKDQLLSQLTRATISTFEDLGFVLPAPELDETQAAAPLAWRARVAFRGPASGWLDVRVSDQVAEALVTNMLGTEDVIDGAVKRDVVGEIANVVCGNVVPALGTTRDVFDLDTPVLTASNGESEALQSVALLELGIEDGRVLLELFVSSESPSEDAA